MRAQIAARAIGRSALLVGWLAGAALGTPRLCAAQQLDWEVDEAPAGPRLRALRGVRDGLLGLLDDASDLQVAALAEVSLLGAGVLMLSADALGLIDDNPISQHAFKGVASKSLAKSAWLLHRAGAEAILGSHGLERERYLEAAFNELNPLLAGEPPEERLPLDPLAFLGEGLVHGEVYASQRPALLLGAALASDALLRPLANVCRVLGFARTGDQLETQATTMVREAIE